MSPFTINSLHKVGLYRDAILPQSKTGSNEIARLTTQDGKMHISFCHDAYAGPQESLRHRVALALTPELEESVNRLTKGKPIEDVVYAIRQVKLDLDLRTGKVRGKEEFIGGVHYMVEEIPPTDLGTASAKFARLPISGTLLNDFLYEILTWVAGETPGARKETVIYRTRDDIFSNTHETHQFLSDPDAERTLFTFVREIAQAIRA